MGKKDIEMIDNWKYEKELTKKGYKYIGGCDEAGRGPLIGPVVAACCILPADFKLEGLTDSKKLSEKKREEMYDYIINNTVYGIGIVSAEEIDEINIYKASKKAMTIAIKEVRTKLPIDYVLTDAMPIELDIPVTPIIKGDLLSISISAASVIAKVTRDRMLIELDKEYPMYGFKNHKGYPTKNHLEAISKYGLIEGYRKSYGPIKRYLEKNCQDSGNLKIDRLILGRLMTNCYILTLKDSCLVIDPADDYNLIKEKINNKKILGVIVTHHHFDHIGALSNFDNVYDINNLKEGKNSIGNFNFEVIYTPGHTTDSICIYFKEHNIMFVGDFIFKDGIGRTDLGGSNIDMKNSLDKISSYNKDIIIYPGHGDNSKLGIELNKIKLYRD